MSNKYLWLGIAGIFMLAGIVMYNSKGELYISELSEKHSPAPAGNVNAEQDDFLPVPVRGEIFGRGIGSPKPTTNYSQLVVEYQGRRLQFDMNCQVSPAVATFKKGTSVMFDNRSGDARYIRIGAQSYYFPGYGYRVLTMGGSDASLPATIMLDCGSAQNVGRIIIQQ